MVEDRLAVAGDEGEVPHIVPVRHVAGSAAEGQAEVAVEGRKVAEARCRSVEDLPNPLRKARLEGLGGEREGLDTRENRRSVAARAILRPRENHVDPVG